MKLWLCSLILIPSLAFSAVGKVTELTAPQANIQRDKQQVAVSKGTGVEMNDTITTAKSRIGLTFQDNTQVQITEQSKLVIDDFVYDPKNASNSKLAMKVALGTVRYASGAIAHNNRDKVKLTTPTATIAVRGTDFTMTVDEIGRSLVILLPTCPSQNKEIVKEEDCWVGEIEVSTDAGYVILNQAYQATMVTTSSSMPTDPKIIDVDPSMLNNQLIISPPKNLREIDKIEKNKEAGLLDQDVLEYRELEKNALDVDNLKFSSLDINRLNVDFLDNILDITMKSLEMDELETDPVLPSIGRYPWLQSSYNEEIIIVSSERPPHIAEVTVERNTDGMLNITQDGISANIQLNGGGTNVAINIVQTQ